MELTKVVSSTIEAIGYEPKTRTMDVQFKSGGTYTYFGVPLEEYQALMDAASKGSHLHKRIKGKYASTKRGPAPTSRQD